MIFGLATVAFILCLIVLIYLQKPASITPRRLQREDEDNSDKN
jgi:hypothetical protein